jgi:hypothetical protein
MEKIPSSEDFAKRFELQAGARNKKRPLIERIMGNNEVVAGDVLREEAETVNSLVDHSSYYSTERGFGEVRSSQEAADEIIGSKEFGGEAPGSPEDQATIVFLERMKKVIPDIELFLSTGHIKGVKQFLDEQDSQGSDSLNKMAEEFRNIISMKVDTMIRSQDMPALYTLVNDLADITSRNYGWSFTNLVAPVDLARIVTGNLVSHEMKNNVEWLLLSYKKGSFNVEPEVNEALDLLGKINKEDNGS